jgi:hypothetical protein
VVAAAVAAAPTPSLKITLKEEEEEEEEELKMMAVDGAASVVTASVMVAAESFVPYFLGGV